MTNIYDTTLIMVPCGLDEVSDIHFMRDNRETIQRALRVCALIEDSDLKSLVAANKKVD